MATHEVYEKGLGNRPDLGSDHANDWEFATGSITIPRVPVSDGQRILTIGDKSVALSSAVGQTFNTEYGKLTVTGYNPATGVLSYTYELTTNVYDKPDADEFDLVTIHVQNNKSGSFACAIQFTIIDDEPTANPDVDVVKSGTWTEKGNVITGVGTKDGPDGPGADITGADGAKVVSISTKAKEGKDENAVSPGGTVIEGKYGTLTIKPDGSYTYERHVNTEGGVKDVFHYTLKDGDGDTSRTTLTIKINDATPGLTVNRQNNVTVDEDDLDTTLIVGSDPVKEPVSVDKSFSFQSWDGVASLTVRLEDGTDVEVFTNGVFAEQTITTPYGEMHFTHGEWDPVQGKGTVYYTYTLTANFDHSTNDGENTFVETYYVNITDLDGDSAPEKSYTVTIIDDVPDARNDTDNTAFDDVSGLHKATGNVITGLDTNEGEGGAGADVKGADGAGAKIVGVIGGIANGPTNAPGTVGVEILGNFGKLILNDDGSYEYVRDPNTPSNVDDWFTYTLMDGDGDMDTATLKIHLVSGRPIITDLTPNLEGGDTTVHEAGLPTGSNPDGDEETNTGDFTIASPDGVRSLTIGGKEFIKDGVLLPGQTIATNKGTLTVTDYDPATGLVSYSYTLTSNQPHQPEQGDNDDTPQFDNLTVVLEDFNGNTNSAVLSVKILDDVPEANDDTDSLAVGTLTETGNVITGVGTTEGPGGTGTDVKGADAFNARVVGVAKGDTATPIDQASTVGVAIDGEYGTLWLWGDGQYTYTRKAGTPGGVDDVFTYTLVDGDGDMDTATLTITVENGTPGLDNLTPGVDGGDTVVNENGLPNGSDPNGGGATNTGTFKVVSPDFVKLLTIGGVEIIKNDQLTGNTVTTPFGTLVVTDYDPADGTVTYSYTLDTEQDHLPGRGDNGVDGPAFDDLPIVLVDQDDQSATGNLLVKILDDVPVVTVEGATETNDTTPITGVWTLIEGADGVDRSVPLGKFQVSVEGGDPQVVVFDQPIPVQDKGVLVFHGDGTWTFTPDQVDSETTVTFALLAEDRDGDKDDDAHTITINPTPSTSVPGVLVVGSNSDDKYGSTPLHTVPKPNSPQLSGEIVGSGGDDVLIGDVGGFGAVAGKRANIVLVLDTSGSMDDPLGQSGDDRMTLLQDAVEGLLDSLSQSGGLDVRVHIVNFGTNAGPGQTFDLIVGGNPQLGVVDDAQALVNGLSAGGSTNYEAPLNRTLEWIQSASADRPLAGADINTVVFVSDGEPNRWNDGDGSGSGDYQINRALSEVLGQVQYPSSPADDTNEPALILANQGWDIQAVGLALGTTAQVVEVSYSVDRVLLGDVNSNDVNPATDTDTGFILRASSDTRGHLALVSGWSDADVSNINNLVDVVQSGSGDTFAFGVEGGADDDELDVGEVLRFDFGLATDYDGQAGPYQTSLNGTTQFLGTAAKAAQFDFRDFNAGNSVLEYKVHYTDGSSENAVQPTLTGNNTLDYVINAAAGKLIDYIEFTVTAGEGGKVRLDSVTRPTALEILDAVEGATGDGALNVQTALELEAAIGSLGGGDPELAAAGSDVIHGTDGDDIIFGDVLFTDAWAAQVGLPNGSGWAVLEKLQDVNGWTNAELMDFIRDNQDALKGESGRSGGHDQIFGGDGNDTIYGQEGNDLIDGGRGNDTLWGGSGADTFLFGYVGPANEDKIMDYSYAQGDRIDLSNLLPGGVNQGTLGNYVQTAQVNGGQDTLISTIGAADQVGTVVTLVGVSSGLVRIVVDGTEMNFNLG